MKKLIKDNPKIRSSYPNLPTIKPLKIFLSLKIDSKFSGSINSVNMIGGAQ
jgi:hypothetical protein